VKKLKLTNSQKKFDGSVTRIHLLVLGSNFSTELRDADPSLPPNVKIKSSKATTSWVDLEEINSVGRGSVREEGGSAKKMCFLNDLFCFI